MSCNKNPISNTNYFLSVISLMDFLTRWCAHHLKLLKLSESIKQIHYFLISILLHNSNLEVNKVISFTECELNLNPLSIFIIFCTVCLYHCRHHPFRFPFLSTEAKHANSFEKEKEAHYHLYCTSWYRPIRVFICFFALSSATIESNLNMS